MMDPQRKNTLRQFTTAAKAIIYDAGRMRQFLQMMDTKTGAIQAIQTVIGVIEQKKPVPPDILPFLGVNIYMLMVDVASEATGAAPDPEIVKGVIVEILATLRQKPQQPVQQTQAAPPGIIAQGA